MIIFEMGDGTGLTVVKSAYNTRKEMINEVKPYIIKSASYYKHPNSIWCKLSFMYGMHVLHEQNIYMNNINEQSLDEFLNAYKGD